VTATGNGIYYALHRILRGNYTQGLVWDEERISILTTPVSRLSPVPARSSKRLRKKNKKKK
jgi:hypothetical protein